MITATPEQFDAAMEQAVRERGADFVYPKGEDGWAANRSGMCRYVRSDKPEPACLIGLVLHKLGVPLQTLRNYERESAGTVLRATVLDSVGSVEEALNEAQSAQDSGYTWGQALVEYRAARGI